MAAVSEVREAVLISVTLITVCCLSMALARGQERPRPLHVPEDLETVKAGAAPITIHVYSDFPCNTKGIAGHCAQHGRGVRRGQCGDRTGGPPP